jgi:hypothetical protein
MKLWPCVLSGILVAGCGDSEDPGSDRSFAIELDPTQDTTPTIVLAGSHLIDPFCEDNPGAWVYIKYYPLMRSGGYSKAFVPCESVPTLATSDAPTEIPELPPDAADELAPFDLACAFTVSDTAPAALVKIQEGVGNCGEPLLAIPFTRLRPAATISCSPPVVSGIAPDMEKSPDEGSVFEVCFQDRL